MPSWSAFVTHLGAIEWLLVGLTVAIILWIHEGPRILALWKKRP